MYRQIGKQHSPYELDLIDQYNNFSCHYMTITEIIKDPYLNKTIVKVSTWGEEYYIYYEDFVDTINNNLMPNLMCGIFSLNID